MLTWGLLLAAVLPASAGRIPAARSQQGDALEFQVEAGTETYAAVTFPGKVRVWRGKGELVQELALDSGVRAEWVSLSTGDYDFDGRADLRWDADEGDAWLAIFDPARRRFFEPFFLNAPEADAERKVVISSFGNDLSWTTELSRFTGGKPEVWRSEQYVYQGDGMGRLTVEEWRGESYRVVCVMDLFWDTLEREKLVGGDPRVCDEAIDRAPRAESER
jgi:hypothetical protein